MIVGQQLILAYMLINNSPIHTELDTSTQNRMELKIEINLGVIQNRTESFP